LKKIKAIVFDLDGTLVKFTLDYKSLRRDVISSLIRRGAPSTILSPDESVFKTFDTAAMYFRNDGGKEAAVMKAYDEMIDICEKYEMEAAHNTVIMPGVEIALQSLRKLGMKIGLCTNNGLKAVMYLVKKYRLREYFDAIVTRESIPNMKPDTGHFLATIAPLRVTPEETLMVGDSVMDIKASKPLGATVVGINSGYKRQMNLQKEGADYLVESIVEVIGILKALNS